jgi:hypothetical protein
MQRAMMKRLAIVILVMLVVGIAWQLTQLIPARQSGGHPATNSQMCNNNFKNIGMAIHRYLEHHGTFPPAFVADQDGQPAHSWRVLILPFLNQHALYDKYRFDEPWNGPNNSQLAELMPSFYRCPSFAATESNAHHTNYMAIVTPDSVISGATPVGINAITDSQSSTILVTESDARTVHWMSPDDLAMNNVFSDLGAGSCPHSKGRNVLLADRSVQFLPQRTTQDEFAGLVTRAGGEPVVELRSHP